jgi:SAM-dependent methyltransferase
MSQVEYGPLARYYELINEHCVPYDDQAAFVCALLDEFGPQRDGALVLDVACGPGLLSRRLQRLGLRAVGLDLAEGLLRQATGDLRGRLVRADMRRLPFAGSLDLACCLLHTINYMTDDDDLTAALSGIRAALRPGGVATVDFIAYEPAREWGAQWTETIQSPEVTIVAEHNQTPDWRRMVATDRHTYTVYEPDGAWSVSGEDHLRITSPPEMRRFAEACGLEVLAICGKYALDSGLGFDGGVLVARRP